MTADLSALDIERRLTAIESTLPTFATKADIHSLRVEMQAMRTEWKSDLGEMRTEWKSDLSEMRSEWKADLGEMKAEFGELKAELHAREARLIKWIAGLMLAGVAAAAGLAIAVNQALGPGVGG